MLVPPPSKPASFKFGCFEYRAPPPVLLKDGEVAHVGSRALAVLGELLRWRGAYVPRHVLIETAWPQTFVDDCNLRAQVAALRRVLDAPGQPSHIVNSPARGYAFAAPLPQLASAKTVETTANRPWLTGASADQALHKASLTSLQWESHAAASSSSEVD